MGDLCAAYDCKAIAAIASVVTGLIANIPYVIVILRGHRPPYTTYLGWTLIGVLGLLFHVQAIDAMNSKWSALFPALFAIVPLAYLCLLASLGARWYLDGRDKICLGLILASASVWVVSHVAGFGTITFPLIALVATDVFSSWPILQNAWLGEESRPLNRLSWFLTTVSAAFGAGSVAAPASAEMIYPGYLFLMMGVIFLCSFRRTASGNAALTSSIHL